MEYNAIVTQVIEFLGTFAFAISGIRHAAAKHFDWFGGYVCGIAVPNELIINIKNHLL